MLSLPLIWDGDVSLILDFPFFFFFIEDDDVFFSLVSDIFLVFH